MAETTSCNRERQQVASPHSGDQIFENWMGKGGEVCRMYGGEDKFIGGYGERLLEKKITRRFEDNIKICPKERG